MTGHSSQSLPAATSRHGAETMARTRTPFPQVQGSSILVLRAVSSLQPSQVSLILVFECNLRSRAGRWRFHLCLAYKEA